MNKYMKFMSKQEFSTLELEDKRMPHTKVDKDNNSLKYVHQSEDNDPSVLLC